MKNSVTALGAAALMAALDSGVAANAQSYPGDRVSGEHFATRSVTTATQGMAATAHPLASQVAINVLQSGGNAVDAAIAANAAIGLMEPTGNGIGGDIFVIIWDPETRQVYGINGAGRSPMGLSYDDVVETLGEGNAIPPLGAMPVSVPGTVDGWFAMHERFGSMPMDEILAPAIRYAENGFPLTETIAYYWERNMRILDGRFANGEFEEFANAQATYLTEDGDAPREGEIFRNPDLANTYRLIAEGGRDAFYDGPIAQTIHDYMERIGGWIAYEDLAAHRTEWVEPLSVNYRGYDVWELPPQGQGIAALQMLQTLEAYDLSSMGFMSAEAIHLMVEAKRLAFEDRARFYSDPAFYDEADPHALYAELISDDYADTRRALISTEAAMQSVTHGDPRIIEDGDTTYLTVADGNGMMVSLIQSNFRGMGSGLVPDGLGFMLQNRGELFSLDPNHPNVYEPGKRPFHTIIPAMITRGGEAFMSFGLMGGAMQPQGHVQIITSVIDFGLNIQQAGDAARWRHDGSTSETGQADETAGVGVLSVESGMPQDVRDALTALGHEVVDGDGGFGGYQAILRDPETGVLYGASEMRKDGAAQGY
ncbi:gamma-glutamyltransferase [Maricaulis sp.]|uniref:gamma-glutamyltransferase n=1 Tax=Maricaulis sp. TaxID=1486257 RepID=UPI0026287504|nr:gamma-glutamyltransferase [Maricaulis sp.]